jgi:hypothetical protein
MLFFFSADNLGIYFLLKAVLRIQDVMSRIQIRTYLIPDPDQKLFHPGCRILDPGSWILHEKRYANLLFSCLPVPVYGFRQGCGSGSSILAQTGADPDPALDSS